MGRTVKSWQDLGATVSCATEPCLKDGDARGTWVGNSPPGLCSFVCWRFAIGFSLWDQASEKAAPCALAVAVDGSCRAGCEKLGKATLGSDLWPPAGLMGGNSSFVTVR